MAKEQKVKKTCPVCGGTYTVLDFIHKQFCPGCSPKGECEVCKKQSDEREKCADCGRIFCPDCGGCGVCLSCDDKRAEERVVETGDDE